MKLYGYIQAIDTRMPNSFTDDEKIAFLNHTLCEVYKICSKECTHRTMAEKEILLPKGADDDSIKSVFAGGCEYFKAGFVRGAKYEYEITDEFKMKLTPSAFGEVVIKYTPLVLFKTIGEITADDTIIHKNEEYENQSGNVPDKYSELIILGALYKMALAAEDTSLAANYKIWFEEKRQRVMADRYKKGVYPITKIVR